MDNLFAALVLHRCQPGKSLGRPPYRSQNLQ
jgi:hypothetical protein